MLACAIKEMKSTPDVRSHYPHFVMFQGRALSLVNAYTLLFLQLI
jgi:hypothetical protein